MARRRVGWKKSSRTLAYAFTDSVGRYRELHIGVKTYTRTNTIVYGRGDRLVIENSDDNSEIANLDSGRARQFALAILDRCNEIEGVK